VWAPWFAWRWWYYGWPFPNTYYVKAAGAAVPGYDAKMRSNGWHYVGRWFSQTGLAWASPVAIAGLIAWPRKDARFALVTLAPIIFLVYLRYVAGVGGDFMGLHRFIMPLFVLAALAVALGVANLGALVARWRAGVVATTIMLTAGAIVLTAFADRQLALTKASLRFGNFANDRGIDTPAYLRAYTHDRALIGKALAPCVRADDYATMLARRREVLVLVNERSVGIDAWLTPTVPMLPQPTAAFRSVADVADWNRRATRNTRPGNLFGQCGVSLPIQHLGAALPVGLQLCSAPGEDAALLSVACAIEEVLGQPPSPMLDSSSPRVDSSPPHA